VSFSGSVFLASLFLFTILRLLLFAYHSLLTIPGVPGTRGESFGEGWSRRTGPVPGTDRGVGLGWGWSSLVFSSVPLSSPPLSAPLFSSLPFAFVPAPYSLKRQTMPMSSQYHM
jgi:hypothetical protein